MSRRRCWVKDLRPGLHVEEMYVLASKDIRARRGGGSYLAVTLTDKTGEVGGLVWENVEQMASRVRAGQVVRVSGHVQRYNGRLQVVIRSMTAVPEGEFDMDDFVRGSEIDGNALWRELEELADSVKNPHLRQLLFRVLSDPEVKVRFLKWPAAKSMHHAHRHGLLQHTVSVAKAVSLLSVHYGADRSLAVAGAILHDIGKIWELEPEPAVRYTAEGRLLGHLVVGANYVARKADEISGFPEELKLQLLHILVSHHGEPEFGSPRRPKTPEAVLVHAMDKLDAEIWAMLDAIEGIPGDDDDWSGWVPLLGRYVYRRRPSSGSTGGGSGS